MTLEKKQAATVIISEVCGLITESNNENMSDRELADRILRQGDTGCFAEIVRRYSGMIFSKALSAVHREELAAEITQQTFVKAYSRLHCWRSESLGPWLLSIVWHLALNALGDERRHRSIPIEGAGNVAEDGYSPEKEQMLQRMEEALGNLPDIDREIIELYYYKKQTTKDIAKNTGLSQQNILVRLHRIRERLKKKLEQ